jgi:pimeloyl-ACP methyl ester carboxylesterase
MKNIIVSNYVTIDGFFAGPVFILSKQKNCEGLHEYLNKLQTKEKNMAKKRSIAAIIIAVLALSTGCATPVSPHAPAVRSGYAPVNGLKMYYEIHGSTNGESPPLLLLHGGGSTIETSFGKVLPALAKTRQVIAFEQQGHGHTADIDRPFTFEQSAEDTVGLLRYLKITKADFFGYSNGGHIALEIAIRHSNVARKLVVESAMFNREGSDPGFWESFRHAKLDDMPAELREAYLRVAPHPEDLPTFFAKSVKRMLDFKGWTPEEIKSIDAPTLVIIGDHDIVRPEHAVLMFRLLPNAQLAVLPGTDHMTIVNRSAWLVSMIEAFLNAPMPETTSKGKSK